jgi:hypothetical protein
MHTFFEEVIHHLLKAFEISQYLRNIIIKVIATLHHIMENNKGFLEPRIDVK